MDSKPLHLIIAFFLLFSASLKAEPETRVAVYDSRAIYRAEAIYQKLHMLHVKNEIKAAIIDVDKKTDDILMKMIGTDDPAEIRSLQNQINALKSKKSSILRAIRDSGKRGNESDIDDFVKTNYKDRYDVIIEKKSLSNTSHGIHLNVTPTDITKIIIIDLTNKINES
jgi:hypothetical protein